MEIGSDACSEMPSPDKLRQLEDVYVGSPGKLHSLGAVASPPTKKRPTARKAGTLALHPLPGQKNGCGGLSPKRWKRWMHEAQELHASSSVFLATSSSESLAQVANEGLQLVLNPVVARTDEKLAALIEARAIDIVDLSTSSKQCPPLDRAQQWRALVAKPRKRKTHAAAKVEPLLSTEMREKLQAHLEAKIKGDIWENEVRSRLARPLSASLFCSRSEQLRHPPSAPQFISPTAFEDPTTGWPQFPYSTEAHVFAKRIHRCRAKACFRVVLKARVRLVAVSIRALRRRGVPLLEQGFLRRRRAALHIQRRYRRFRRWRTDVLHPFVCRYVSLWIDRSMALTLARGKIAREIEALYHARRARRQEAARRAAHLRRYAAKTRVCLFVHQVWTVGWFRNKRSTNVDGMKRELAALEASDHDVHLQFTTMMATAIGKVALKRELALWRVDAQKRPAQRSPSASELSSSEVEIDPTVLRLRQAFQIFDLDGSGTLDLDEFQLMLSYLRGKKKPTRSSALAAQPPKLTTVQVRNLFAELDDDDSGGITCSEFESWWTKEHQRSTLSTSASANFLSRGLEGLLLQSHGLLFWLLGRKQQLERKFVKKLMARRAMDAAKRELLQHEIDKELLAGNASGVSRCCSCGRRFGLRRDLVDHDCKSRELVVDTFTLKRWLHEEEFRLLEDVKGEL